MDPFRLIFGHLQQNDCMYVPEFQSCLTVALRIVITGRKHKINQHECVSGTMRNFQQNKIQHRHTTRTTTLFLTVIFNLLHHHHLHHVITAANMVARAVPLRHNPINPDHFTVIDGRLYFSAQVEQQKGGGGDIGRGAWVADSLEQVFPLEQLNGTDPMHFYQHQQVPEQIWIFTAVDGGRWLYSYQPANNETSGSGHGRDDAQIHQDHVGSFRYFELDHCYYYLVGNASASRFTTTDDPSSSAGGGFEMKCLSAFFDRNDTPSFGIDNSPAVMGAYDPEYILPFHDYLIFNAFDTPGGWDNYPAHRKLMYVSTNSFHGIAQPVVDVNNATIMDTFPVMVNHKLFFWSQKSELWVLDQNLTVTALVLNDDDDGVDFVPRLFTVNERVILVDTLGRLYSTNGEHAPTSMLPFEEFSDFFSPQFLTDVEGPPFLEFNGYLYIATANYVLYTNGTHTYTLSGSQSYIFAHNFVVVNDDTLCFFAPTVDPVPALFCGNGTHAELVDVQWPPDGVPSSSITRQGLVTEWNGRVVVGMFASTVEVVPWVLVISAAATARFRTVVWTTATVWATLWATFS